MSSQIRILHVDDDPDFGNLVPTFLEEEDEGFLVETATSAERGLDVLDRESVDCVVSDYEMPGRDGIEFLEAVRADYPVLPFILFTGKGSEEIASEAISAGVTDYLQKSHGTDQYTVLANRIKNVVAGHRARRDADRKALMLEQIQHHVSEVVWISDPQKDEMTFISDAYRDIWGRAPESLIENPRSFIEGIHPEDSDRVKDALAIQRDQPEEYEETYRVQQPDGTGQWVRDRAAGVSDGSGTLEWIVGIATDITELKEYQRKLEAERAFTQSALEIAVDLYWGIDTDGYVTRWSDTDGSVTGYTDEDAIGRHTSTFHPDDHFPRIEAAIGELRETGSTVVEADFLRKDGERVPFEFAGTTITDDQGELEWMCGVGRDRRDGSP